MAAIHNVLAGSAGAPASFSATISANQTNLNLRTWALANGWDGSAAATITISNGVYVYSTTAGTPGLTINGSWPGGVTLVNNGFVLGMGGTGGGVTAAIASIAATAGSNAIDLGVNCTIQNNSYIAGGGGGGGRGNVAQYLEWSGGGGGGAGGGTGGRSQQYTGGAGGAPGSAGSDAPASQINVGAGGGGGRVLPGTGGSGGINGSGSYGRGGGAGGGGGAADSQTTGNGAAGGSSNAAGSNAPSANGGGGGGGWGASGGTGGVAGAAGGKAVNLNGFTVTWAATGTRYGAIS